MKIKRPILRDGHVVNAIYFEGDQSQAMEMAKMAIVVAQQEGTTIKITLTAPDPYDRHVDHQLRIWAERHGYVTANHVDSDGKGYLLEVTSDSPQDLASIAVALATNLGLAASRHPSGTMIWG